MSIDKTKQLAKEARKYKNAEEFIQSVRLPNMIKEDTKKLAELNAMSKKRAVYLYDSIEEFNHSRNIVKRNLEGAKQELKELNIPKNKFTIGEFMDIIRSSEGHGWFARAENFYNNTVCTHDKNAICVKCSNIPLI